MACNFCFVSNCTFLHKYLVRENIHIRKDTANTYETIPLVAEFPAGNTAQNYVIL